MKIRELLWPCICPFCGKASAQGICAMCRRTEKALRVTEPRCMRCGKPVRYGEQEYCYDCMHTHHDYDRGVGLWLHRKPVSTSIYQFKYHNQRFFAAVYAREMAIQARGLIRVWSPEVILPIPLHTGRRRKRGYNQAELLAEELGRIFQIPVVKGLLRRVQGTDPQKELDQYERRQNMKRAFGLTKSPEGIRRVLLVDDIYDREYN